MIIILFKIHLSLLFIDDQDVCILLNQIKASRKYIFFIMIEQVCSVLARYQRQITGRDIDRQTS